MDHPPRSVRQLHQEQPAVLAAVHLLQASRLELRKETLASAFRSKEAHEKRVKHQSFQFGRPTFEHLYHCLSVTVYFSVYPVLLSVKYLRKLTPLVNF